MCGRFVIFDEAENEEIRRIVCEINKKYSLDDGSKLKTGEIFPTDNVPIITNKDGRSMIGLARWGFPNFKSRGVIINARSETLADKPTFRNILPTGRCVIPASGYYEWMCTDTKKEKYLIRTERPTFYMAGLYSGFIDKNNTSYTGVVIITTESATSISHIHNRMPVILPNEKINSWLMGKNTEWLKSLLIPYENIIAKSAAG